MAHIYRIATHVKPHLDEIAAIWLLRKFGEATLPGSSTAKVLFWGNGGSTPDGRPAEIWEKEGVLLLGIGGGRFDEHPSGASNGRKEGECTTTLVAKALGIEDNPVFKKILRYVLTEDTKGGDSPFGLAALVKLLHDQLPEEPERVMDWTMTALDAKLNEQEQFNAFPEEEWRRIATLEEISGPRDRKYKLAVVLSDNPQAAKFARSLRGGRADIVVVKRSTGHVQIFTNNGKGFRISLRDVAQSLRIMEQEAKGERRNVDFVKLGAEGKLEGAEEWFYHLQGQMLLNGSLTATDVPPTKLSLDEIRNALVAALDPRAFSPEHRENCLAGICTASGQRPCAWYKLGLQRCRQIRYEMLHADKVATPSN